jgi:hypothetical protein
LGPTRRLLRMPVSLLVSDDGGNRVWRVTYPDTALTHATVFTLQLFDSQTPPSEVTVWFRVWLTPGHLPAALSDSLSYSFSRQRVVRLNVGTAGARLPRSFARNAVLS